MIFMILHLRIRSSRRLMGVNFTLFSMHPEMKTPQILKLSLLVNFFQAEQFSLELLHYYAKAFISKVKMIMTSVLAL